MKVNSREVREMEEVLSGGLTAVGMKDISKMESNVVMEFSIDKEAIKNIRVIGKMVCFKQKELSILIMENAIKDSSKKISFMEMEYSIKMTLSFMGSGKITNYQ